jgi:hypothetical protein
MTIMDIYFPYKGYYLFFGEYLNAIHASIRTDASLNGQASISEKKAKFFDGTYAFEYNPHGWKNIYEKHWTTDDNLFAEMEKEGSKIEEIFNEYYNSMKDFIDDLSKS